MPSLDWLLYHRLVAIEYANTKNPELLPVVLAKTKQHLLLRQHLSHIDRLFEEKNIPYLVLKGIPLNQQLYGSSLQKYSKDIDLLVDQQYLFAAHRCILSLGYEPQSTVPIENLFSNDAQLYGAKDIVYYHLKDHTIIELHRKISGVLEMNFGDLGRAEHVFIDGRLIPVLCREENFLYLCLHAALHHWQRLIWLADIAQFYQKMTLSWGALLEKARKHDCIRPLLEARYLLAEKFSMDLPVVPHAWRDRLAVRLHLHYVRYLWCPHHKGFSPLKDALCSTLLMPRLKQKGYYFFGLLCKGKIGMRFLERRSRQR